MTNSVLTAVWEKTAVVTLNRPAKLNAWTVDMQQQLLGTLTALETDAAINSIVITGAGDRAFCAGQDLGEASTFTQDSVSGWLSRLLQLYEMPLRSRKPYVAALNGVAAGSGYQFAMLCDLRVAHDRATLGQPEVKSGIPSITGQYITMLSLGHSRTTELMLTGRLMAASEAHQYGLLHAVTTFDRLIPDAVSLAAQLADQPNNAIAATKQRICDRIWPGLVESFTAAESIDKAAWADGEPQRVATAFVGRHTPDTEPR